MTLYAITYSYPTSDRYHRGQTSTVVEATSPKDALRKIQRGTADTGYRACPDARMVRCKISARQSAECEGHPASEFSPMGETFYCDGSCQTQPA